jgi:uncharacterized damage-inducible protein DinB
MVSALKNLAQRLYDSLDQLTETQYRQQTQVLFHASIGQHTRHVIELFDQLEKGYETGLVDYDNRKRDLSIENDKKVALTLLHQMKFFPERDDKPLRLAVSFGAEGGQKTTIATNYNRELIYNVEHMIHHMALIRIGIKEVAGIELPADFGVAVSTLKYQAQCAQ